MTRLTKTPIKNIKNSNKKLRKYVKWHNGFRRRHKVESASPIPAEISKMIPETDEQEGDIRRRETDTASDRSRLGCDRCHVELLQCHDAES